MLVELYPRLQARFSALAVLGRFVEGFIAWLYAKGYHRHQVRLRVREMPQLDAVEQLARRAVCQGCVHLIEEVLGPHEDAPVPVLQRLEWTWAGGGLGSRRSS